MSFEFATASRIIFGQGKFEEIGPLAAEMGRRAFVVTGSSTKRAQPLLDRLAAQGIEAITFSVSGEPTIELVETGVKQLQAAHSKLVISLGGGSAIDAGKAIAALAANPGQPLDYLEVIGLGKPLENAPLPFIAIPTTAGTGAEVTKNAVLASPAHRVKVSLRSPALLPNVALVDPALTTSMPPAVTATTGMDALTQVLEPYVTHLSNPLTDALCLTSLRKGATALRRAFEDGNDLAAREDMALASLCGGLALANAKLGAVHGFAGVLGGMFPAPHGAICACLLPPTMAVNIRALQSRDAANPALERYQQIARIFTGQDSAAAEDGVAWVQDLSQTLNIPGLSDFGIQRKDLPEIIEKSAQSSSMKGNPIVLTPDEMAEILEKALAA